MARTAKTPASNHSELSNALTAAEQARTELASATALLDDARKQIVLLNEKLALARDLFAQQRSELRVLRASRPARKPLTEAQIAYRADAAQRSAAFAAQRAQRAALSAQYFAAHPDARSASDQEIAQWAQEAQ